ncbi:hypothetical protein SARC_14691, partial [Sphaeroforma arctica JP610]
MHVHSHTNPDSPLGEDVFPEKIIVDVRDLGLLVESVIGSGELHIPEVYKKGSMSKILPLYGTRGLEGKIRLTISIARATIAMTNDGSSARDNASTQPHRKQVQLSALTSPGAGSAHSTTGQSSTVHATARAMSLGGDTNRYKQQYMDNQQRQTTYGSTTQKRGTNHHQYTPQPQPQPQHQHQHIHQQQQQQQHQQWATGIQNQQQTQQQQAYAQTGMGGGDRADGGI